MSTRVSSSLHGLKKKVNVCFDKNIVLICAKLEKVTQTFYFAKHIDHLKHLKNEKNRCKIV